MSKKLKIVIITGGIILILLVLGGIIVSNLLFGAPQKQAEAERFVIPINASEQSVIANLSEQGFIKNEWGFRYALGGTKIKPGGYKIAKSMTAWEIAKILAQESNLKWVVIPEGLRKEQIAELIGKELSWSQEDKTKWITTSYTAMNYETLEGVYFPDTYLIPIDENPINVAARLRAKFNEEFAPYSNEALAQNIKWDTLIKIASIVQREAAGKGDMPLIAGIIWNRLLADKKLEIDATIQYIRDDVTHYGEARYDKQPENYSSEGSWWTPIKPEDKQIESPYNTYRNKGLPPHPICNPGLDAIEAVLNPAETECLYYLHDANKQIHCAKTYEEHQENIKQFLRGE
ncbi:MAG TPA: endolytic transglycosylase MltG [Candidatus Paceibacterota bacterium]|nr:endolytic transglycosylase MltG [Candidatus Paceibacterota bacterium]